MLSTAILLACGASTSFKPLPMATLAPGVAPFEVVTLGADALQARAGRDGTLLWQQPAVSESGGTLLAADGIIFHRGKGSEAVEAFAADSGVLLWRLSECPGYDDTLTAAGELLFVTCGANVPTTPQTVGSDTLYALDTATGKPHWQAHGEHFRAVAGDLVITQTPSGLAARTLEAGDLLWSRALTLARQLPPSLGDPLSSGFDIEITAANGTLYLSPDGQYVVALRATDGSMRWQSAAFAYLANAPMLLGRLSPQFVVVAATASTIIARTDSSSGYGVVALDATSGAVRWHIEDDSPGSSLTSLVTADGAIFVNGFVHPNDPGQTLRRLDPDTGTVLWSVAGPVMRAPPLWYGLDVLYVSDGPRLFALVASEGRRLFDDQGLNPAHLAANADVISAADGHDLYLLSALDGKRIWETKGAGILRAVPIIINMSG